MAAAIIKFVCGKDGAMHALRSASGDAKQWISGGVGGLTAQIVGGILWAARDAAA
jgi:hypothetical protein